METGEVLKDIVGSAYYIAPEVLKRRYGPEVDIWSIGVMLYILLCGVPPFWAETEHGIFNAILRGQVDFASDPWPNISAVAKDLVKKMLTVDPKQRITAFEVLSKFVSSHIFKLKSVKYFKLVIYYERSRMFFFFWLLCKNL
ncbi:putative protein kinase CAMK-CDPK family [Dioscorea sansibarensis]